MPRDFKIGLLLGLFMVVGVIIWLSTRDSLSFQTRQARKHQALLQEQTRGKTNQASLAPGTQPPAPPAEANESPSPREDAPSPSDPPRESVTLTRPPDPPDQSQESDQAERPKIRTSKFHIVRSGDTLSGIALEHYGTVQGIKKIVEANSKVLKDPNKIIPGMKLIIPD